MLLLRVLNSLVVSLGALEYFELTRTLTEIKSKRIPVVIPYPNRFVTLPALPSPKPAGDERKILIVKFGPLTI